MRLYRRPHSFALSQNHITMTRRNQTRGNAPTPLSLRLTPIERKELETAATGQSLSAYIRSRLFAANVEAPGDTDTNRLSRKARQQLLARILGELGRSELSRSMAEFAEAARGGVLPLSPDVVAEIRSACAHIREVRNMLICALGLSKKD